MPCIEVVRHVCNHLTMHSTFSAKNYFEQRGLTISHWALEHGFDPRQVYAVLSGRTRGKRGKAHQIAVALGLKEHCEATAEEVRGAELPAQRAARSNDEEVGAM